MAQMGRSGLSVSQKEDIWRRWKQGESHSDIGRALEKKAAPIHGSIRIHGGIAPLPRKRSSRALRWEERIVQTARILFQRGSIRDAQFKWRVGAGSVTAAEIAKFSPGCALPLPASGR